MSSHIHITSGDMAGGALAKAGLPGEVFVWHDILYDGPRNPGWPHGETLAARARFIEGQTGGGLDRQFILNTLNNQYRKLREIATDDEVTLWFDACLFDQSMLAHVLTCLRYVGRRQADLLCIDDFPGIEPYDGLGQLTPQQLAGVYDRRRPVTGEQFDFAETVDAAFAQQDRAAFEELAESTDAPLPWIPPAVARWLDEWPDVETGLGRLERLALAAIRDGCETPDAVFKAVGERDTHPLYWGDITLWAKINALADRTPPLVRISGPTPRLPQWEGIADLTQYRLEAGATRGLRADCADPE